MRDQKVDEQPDLGRDMSCMGIDGGNGQRKAPVGQHALESSLAQARGGQKERTEDESEPLTRGFDQHLGMVADELAGHLDADVSIGPVEPPHRRDSVIGVEQTVVLGQLFGRLRGAARL